MVTIHSVAIETKLEEHRNSVTTKSSTIHTLESKILTLKSELLAMSRTSDEITRLQQEQEKLEENNSQINIQWKNWESEMGVTVTNIDNVLNERSQLHLNFSKKEDEVQQEKDLFQSRLSKLEQLHSQISEYVLFLTLF